MRTTAVDFGSIVSLPVISRFRQAVQQHRHIWTKCAWKASASLSPPFSGATKPAQDIPPSARSRSSAARQCLMINVVENKREHFLAITRDGGYDTENQNPQPFTL